MATIAVQSLYDQKIREFFVSGSSQDRFQLDFIDAVNRSLRRINIRANLAAPLTTVSYLSDNITIDNADFEFIIADLVTDELVRMGQRPAKGVIIRTISELAEEIDLIRQTALHVRQDADGEADENYDNVGLGALGP